MRMDLFHAVIFGIVEGVTEFLPVSSTGHLILTAKILGLSQDNFLKSFDIVIQLGAIASVLVLYWRRFLLDRAALVRVAIAFAPSAVFGLVLYSSVKHLLGISAVVVWSLLIGGIALIVFELTHTEHSDAEKDVSVLSYRQAAVIGLFQVIAMIPGVSRSAATIIGGMISGLSRRTAVEFSFLLAVPTMAAATGLDLMKNAGSFSGDQTIFLFVGFVVAFCTALASIVLLLRFVRAHTFVSFGIYRIVAALVFLILIL